MPEYIESRLDDCEYASDPSAVLRFASRTEAGWLAHLARERAMQETEALEPGLERELQVWQPNLCPSFWSSAHAVTRAVGVSTARSAQLPRPADARCPCDRKTSTSRGRADRLGRALLGIRRRVCRTIQGRSGLPGQSHPHTFTNFLKLRILFLRRLPFS